MILLFFLHQKTLLGVFFLNFTVFLSTENPPSFFFFLKEGV